VGEHIPLDGPYAIGNFIRDALREDCLTVKGDGKAIRTYLYGRDMAHWLMTLLANADGGTCFNVGSDQPFSMLELANLVAACLSPGKPVIMQGFANPGGAARSIYVPNIDKARSLGLDVETGLTEAIAMTARAIMADSST
jgi:nucleoside-diphosphate-sugar epimerase